jgi:hypothetical protein
MMSVPLILFSILSNNLCDFGRLHKQVVTPFPVWNLPACAILLLTLSTDPKAKHPVTMSVFGGKRCIWPTSTTLNSNPVVSRLLL